VRAADAAASILRWKDRDVAGKALFSAGAAAPLNSKGDNPKARQALHTIDQTAIVQAIGAPAENTRPFCGSFFMCGTPMETKAGTAGLEKPDLEKAKALLKEYDGRPVIFMQPSDLSADFNASRPRAEQPVEAPQLPGHGTRSGCCFTRTYDADGGPGASHPRVHS
jgi:hypothetical protein